MNDFDLKFEKDIIAKSLRDPKFLSEALSIVNEHHFATAEYGFVWKVISDLWAKNRELATKQILAIRCKRDFKEQDKQLSVLKTISELFEIEAQSPRTALDELKKFVLYVNAQKTLENSISKLEKNDIEGVYKEFAIASRKNDIETDFTVIDWIEEFEDRQKDRKDIKENPSILKRYPTGIMKLDKILSGGISQKEFGLIMATTSQGKSAFLTNIAYETLRSHKKFKVVYFTFEMSARQVASRQDARWLKLDYEKFKNYNFSNDELEYINKRLSKAKKYMKNRFKIVSYPMGKPTVDSLKRALERFYDEDEFVPDLLLIDSPDHMKSLKPFESTRIEHKNIYKDCKYLAEDSGYAIWASCHAGREWSDKIASSEAAGDSYDKARIADIIVTLNTPKETTRSTKDFGDFDNFGEDDDDVVPENHRKIEAHVAKYRDGEARVNIPLDVDFKKYFFRELQ